MDFVILSLTMLAVGIYGLLTQRHLLKVFVSVELIATAATLNFVMLASPAGIGVGQAFFVLAFSLLVIVHKKYGISDVGDLVDKIEDKEQTETEA